MKSNMYAMLGTVLLASLAQMGGAQPTPEVIRIPGGSDFALMAMAGDGRSAVGFTFRDDDIPQQAARWTPDGGVETMHWPFDAFATAVSYDGRFVAGVIALDEFSTDFEAFLWSADSGILALPSDLDFGDDGPTGISRDGETIVTSNGAIWKADGGWSDIPSPCGDQPTPPLRAMNQFGNAFIGYCPWNFGQPTLLYRWKRPDPWEDYEPLQIGFGMLAGISDDTRLVAHSSAPGTADPGARAQVWEEDVGLRDLELLPGFSAGSNAFAISGNGKVIGGACWDEDRQTVVGTIWIEESVFDINSFVEVNNDPIQGVVALSNDGLRMIVVQNPFGSFSNAYWVDLFPIDDGDNDGDGLLNGWETAGVGIPYFGSDGQIHTYVLDADGDGINDADPDHKNLFVEMDVMAGPSFELEAKLDVETAFDFAPVPNPDGVDGITLHIVIDEEDLPFTHIANSSPGQYPPLGAQMREDHFGTNAERQGDNRDLRLDAKAQAYRYCLGFFESNRAIGGHAEIGGDDMLLYIGGMAVEDKAAIFMHEFGHNLGLGHGGGPGIGEVQSRHINGKPNYPSIMNYAFSYKEDWNSGFWSLDYCREELATIDETDISELASVGSGGGGIYSEFFMPFYGLVADGAPCYDEVLWGEPLVSYADLDPSVRTDLNLDCDTDDFGFTGDLNFLSGSGLPGSTNPSPGQVLEGHDDWANIVLAVSDGGGIFAGREPDGELTEDQRQFMRDNFPPPPGSDCLADWNADGEVNTLDVLGFLNAWAAGDSDADVNGDGYVNTLDVLEFLNAWAAGC